MTPAIRSAQTTGRDRAARVGDRLTGDRHSYIERMHIGRYVVLRNRLDQGDPGLASRGRSGKSEREAVSVAK